MARRRVNTTLDDRTDPMTVEALMCRTYNHPWMPVPQGKARRAELARLGQTESRMVCSRCGAAKSETIDLYTWEVVSRKGSEYPEGYLVQERGTGRLPRRAARQALMIRTSMV